LAWVAYYVFGICNSNILIFLYWFSSNSSDKRNVPFLLTYLETKGMLWMHCCFPEAPIMSLISQ